MPFPTLASTYLLRNEGVYLIVRFRRWFRVVPVGRRTGLHSFACEAELEMDRRRPQNSSVNEFMRTALLSLPSRLRRSYVLESRFIFWNLLFIMLTSSLMLLVYLKKILFDLWPL
ncbi:MAG: hypothetical protein JWO71_2295 [Candidatus Acidoferrum typicum]|nr:hypothetical protein [Candidatus Acidoferrum typicum]